jgi:Tfp pilus assembly protein FimT
MEPEPAVSAGIVKLFLFEVRLTARPSLATVASRKSSHGFSMLELAASLAIVMILSAVAVPSLLRSYRAYVLSDAASRLAGIVKLTRFEAIRKNTQIRLRAQQGAANWTVWTDSNNNSLADSGENQVVLNSMIRVLPAGSVPSPTPITSAIGSAISTFTVQSGSSTVITYDGRGAVDFGGGSPAVYVYYLGNTGIPNFGARAIVLLPSGVVQVWTSASGNWTRLS